MCVCGVCVVKYVSDSYGALCSYFNLTDTVCVFVCIQRPVFAHSYTNHLTVDTDHDMTRQCDVVTIKKQYSDFSSPDR